MNMTVADAARFNSKVHVTDGVDDCWNWTAGKDTHGYGSFGVRVGESKTAKFVTKRAHRVSFFLHHGRQPGASLLHSCDNPSCVRPDHLREGSQAENMADAKERGRTATIAEWQTAKTHCPQGHEYSGRNVYVAPRTNQRHCRICKNAAWMRMYKRRKGE